jgi:3-polyprenyl-4-hydroxybenzoate decarboxylase
VRFQADVDLIVLPGMRTLPLDPSLPPHEGAAVTTAKLGVDATRRLDKPAHAFTIPAPPFAAATGAASEEDARDVTVEELAARVLETIGEGRRFVDFLREWPDVHGGDLVRALAHLRSRGMVGMSDDGHYCATEPVPEVVGG